MQYLKSTPTLFFSLALCFAAPLFSQGITIENGANIVVNGSASVVINNGGLNNAGSFQPGDGAVIFLGNTTAFSGGTGTTRFHHLILRKPAAYLNLQGGIEVNNELTMEEGNLDLKGFNLNLGTTGSIVGERPTSRISGPDGGFIIRMADLSAPSAVNPGNIGVAITSAANPGLTIIRRGHQVQQLSGGFGISRFYELEAANGTGLNANLRFSYFDEELGAIAENELGVYSSFNTDAGGVLIPKAEADATANYIQLNNLPELGKFVLASDISDPARTNYFTGELPTDRRTYLTWGTAYEINTNHYELERSADGRDFNQFATVPAAGTANEARDYTYNDPVPVNGVMYYRYKLVFNDGKTRYSKIVSVTSINGYPSDLMRVYPNPVPDILNIRFSSFENKRVTVQVVNSLFQVVAEKEVTAIVGLNTVACDVSKLIKGVYYVRVAGINRNAIKIMKQ